MKRWTWFEQMMGYERPHRPSKYKHLYVLTRRDMTPGYQGVQSIHAAMEFALRYPDVTETWHGDSNYLCWLSVKNEAVLNSYLLAAWQKQLLAVGFYEPDVNDQLTAIAIQPGQRSALLVKGLPLALKAYKKKGQ